MKYKYLFWDLDGTLVDSFLGCSNSFMKVFEYFGLDISAEECKKYIGPPLRTTFLNLLKSEEKMKKAVEIYREWYLPYGQWESKLFDNIENTLKILKSKGFKMYVATSKGERSAIEILEKYGIIEYFDRVFGADYNLGRVEKEDVLYYAFNESQAIKENSLMIGDSVYDAIGAKILGIDCLAVSYGFGDVNEMQEKGIVHIANTPIDIVDFLV